MNIMTFSGWAFPDNILDKLLPEAQITNWQHGFFSDASSYEDFSAKLQKEPHHLVAYSLGGLTALKLAADFPKQVLSLTLISCFDEFTAVEAPRAQKLAVRQLQRMIDAFNEDPLTVSQNFYLRTILPVEDKTYELPEDFNKEQLAAGLEQLRDISRSDILEKISCPTLILHGEQDLIVEAFKAHRLRSHLKNSQLIFIKDRGHALPLTSENSLRKNISNFIKNTDT